MNKPWIHLHISNRKLNSNELMLCIYKLPLSYLGKRSLNHFLKTPEDAEFIIIANVHSKLNSFSVYHLFNCSKFSFQKYTQYI